MLRAGLPFPVATARCEPHYSQLPGRRCTPSHTGPRRRTPHPRPPGAPACPARRRPDHRLPRRNSPPEPRRSPPPGTPAPPAAPPARGPARTRRPAPPLCPSPHPGGPGRRPPVRVPPHRGPARPPRPLFPAKRRAAPPRTATTRDPRTGRTGPPARSRSERPAISAGKTTKAPITKIGAFSLSGRRGSNSRPQPWQGCALPTELRPQASTRLSPSGATATLPDPLDRLNCQSG